MKLNPKTTLIIPLSRITGGKQVRRIKLSQGTLGKAGLRTETKVTVTIDNKKERATAEKLVASATHVIRRACVSTLIGYLAPQERLGVIDADLAEVRERAKVFNKRAKTCQVSVSAMPIEISVALGPEAARALADHVHGELTKLRDDLHAGDAQKARATLIRSKNLHTLSVGVQAQTIQFAVEEAQTRLRTLNEAIKNSEAPASAGRHLDLRMIEAAIGMFTYEGQPGASGNSAKLSLLGT